MMLSPLLVQAVSVICFISGVLLLVRTIYLLYRLPNQHRIGKKKYRIALAHIYGPGLLSAILIFMFTPIVWTLPQHTLHIGATDQGALVHFISETNPRFLTDLRLIEFGDHHNWMEMYNKNTSGGYYFAPTRTIIMHDAERSVYWHELCHHVWFWLLTNEERQQFEGLHDMTYNSWKLGAHHFSFNIVGAGNITLNEPLFPTMYATMNVEEDWADSCAIYIMDSFESRELDDFRVQFITHDLARISGCGNATVPGSSCLH